MIFSCSLVFRPFMTFPHVLQLSDVLLNHGFMLLSSLKSGQYFSFVGVSSDGYLFDLEPIHPSVSGTGDL